MKMLWIAIMISLPVAALAHAQDGTTLPPSATISSKPHHQSSTAANCAIDLASVDEPAPSPVLDAGVHSPPSGVPDEVVIPDSQSDSPADLQVTQADTANTTVPIPRRGGSIVLKKEQSEKTGPAIPTERKSTQLPSHGVAWYRSPYAALLGILALIVVLSAIFKRYVPATKPLAAGTLRVVGRTPLSTKQSAVLLHVGQRLVLIGVSPDSLRTLVEIADAEEVAFLLGKAHSATHPSHGRFETALAKEFSEYSEEVDETREAPPIDDESLRETKGQLQGLLNKLKTLQSA